MARRRIPSVESDFVAVQNYLDGQIPPRPDGALESTARKIHSATYSLILWKFRLRNLPLCGQPFIEEIASDALQILPQILMGYAKPAKILLRGVLENSLRYIYFIDHPVEFEIMNREAKWYMGIDRLFEYLKSHPVFQYTESAFDAISRLHTLYDDLSAGIHGRRVIDLEMRAALTKIVYTESSAAKEADAVRKGAEAVNFLLAAYNWKQVREFSVEDRRIILWTLPKSAREFLATYEGERI